MEPITPPEALTQAVLDVFRRVLGDSTMTASVSFFEAGGDSLSAAEVMTSIARKLHIDRPESLLLEHPTAAGLAAALLHPFPTMVSVTPGEGRAPLIVLSGSAGYIFAVHALARRLGPRQPVVMLQPPHRRAWRSDRQLVTNAAVAALLDLVPLSGRIAIMGLGGTAYETHKLVHELEAAKVNVSLLIILEATSQRALSQHPLVRAPILAFTAEKAERMTFWKRATTGDTRIVQVHGTVGQLLREPSIQSIATHITVALDACH
jgi:acyl carrier protein